MNLHDDYDLVDAVGRFLESRESLKTAVDGVKIVKVRLDAPRYSDPLGRIDVVKNIFSDAAKCVKLRRMTFADALRDLEVEYAKAVAVQRGR